MKRLLSAVCIISLSITMMAQEESSAVSNVLSISAMKVQYFSDYAKSYVEREINRWQQKDEFEKMADWQARVNETTRNQKIRQLTAQCEKQYIDKYSSKVKLNVVIGDKYDSENEVFLLTDPQFGNMLVSVPISEGRAFKQNWSSARLTPKYFIENDVLALKSLDVFIPSLNKHYTYSNQASLKYELAQVDYSFDPIHIDAPANGGGQKGQQTIGQKTYSTAKSQVDTNIPETNISNANTFVVVIANENYKKVSKVPFALNDGRTFAKYCQRTLGVPSNQIKVYEDATYGDLKQAVAWLKNICDKYDGEASVIFYYAGHGIPDESDKSSYLLPADGDGRLANETGYKLDELYGKLGSMPAKSVTVLLDACFSGANRDGQMLASARGVAVRALPGAPQGNTVVFSAAQGNETALPDEQEGHGMFTYYLLKKLQETKGDITLNDLSQYVIKEVGKRSAVKDKVQTPNVNSAPAVQSQWQNWKLR